MGEYETGFFQENLDSFAAGATAGAPAGGRSGAAVGGELLGEPLGELLSDSRGERQDERQDERQLLSVSDAMALAKRGLEAIVVTLMGEVSEVSVKPGYKAAYFTVKDEGASLPCMMWNNRYKQVGFDLQVGQRIIMTGRFTLYAAKGRMNFDAFSISLDGEGNLRLQVANIAKRLSAEGLTDPNRKRRLPLYPQKIGLVTSPRSAAVHDVLRTLRRRYPIGEVLLAGVPVEGAQAPKYLMEGINCVADAGAEVILLVRGGGSFEDLMPFNDEALARTIAACPVPVVTGIGHEVDTSIADMVSDYRASTPTAAAETVSPSRENLQGLFDSMGQAMHGVMHRRLDKTQDYLGRIAEKALFQDSMMLFAADAQKLDSAADRLSRVLPMRLERMAHSCASLQGRLLQVGEHGFDRFGYMVAQQAGRLEDLSPVSTLSRGYSIARTAAGQIISRTEQVAKGEDVSLTLSDGVLSCTVTEISNEAPYRAPEHEGSTL